MPDYLSARSGATAIPLTLLAESELAAWLRKQPAKVKAWVKSSGFKAKAGSLCLLPGAKGALSGALAGIDWDEGLWSAAGLPTSLPEGQYKLEPEPSAERSTAVALGWWLGCYRFARYKKAESKPAVLAWPKSADRAAVTGTAEAVFLVRDLVNTPANDLGPAELAEAAKALAKRHQAKATVIVGEQLLKRGYPAIHAVGRASSRAPRLIDLRWGSKGPKVTLVGKGVCFDSGGLDLKPSSGMLMMKKDLGGAAQVLGLAHMIMAAGLKLRLRILVPAVENSVSGDAYRPLDVLQTRKGLTVEIGNTDAEGRIILCDALAEAGRDKPDLLIDFATLTGAARVALGTDLPALFCNDGALAEKLLAHGVAQRDPLWRMPLHGPYRKLLDSPVADLSSTGRRPFGGAITAALFLAEFVEAKTPWVHIDLMAWNLSAQPGRPVGGEAMGVRAAYALIAEMAAG